MSGSRFLIRNSTRQKIPEYPYGTEIFKEAIHLEFFNSQNVFHK